MLHPRRRSLGGCATPGSTLPPPNSDVGGGSLAPHTHSDGIFGISETDVRVDGPQFLFVPSVLDHCLTSNFKKRLNKCGSLPFSQASLSNWVDHDRDV